MSFAQEMKDFLNGFQTVQDINLKQKKVAQDAKQYDETMAFNKQKWDQTLEDKKLAREAAAARAKLTDSYRSRSLSLRERDLADRMKDRQVRRDDAALSGVTNPSVSPDAAIEVDDSLAQDDAGIEIPSAVYEETPMQATGGMVAHVADGGPIETPEEDTKAEAIPTPMPRPADLTPAPAAPAQEAPPAAKAAPSQFNDADIKAKAKEATKAGLDLLEQDARNPKNKNEALPTDGKQKAAAPIDINSPDGAPTQDDVAQIDAKIDGKNELQPYMKGAARLAYLYQYALDKGDTEGAKRVSARILQYNMMAAKTQGSLALQALQNGDVESGAKLLADAYDNVPDGRKLDYKVQPDGTVAYAVMDGDKVIQKGVADTSALWQMANSTAKGTEFIQRVMQLATEDSSPSGGGGGKKKMTYTQATDAYGEAYANFQKLKTDYQNIGDVSDEEKRTAYKELQAAQQELIRSERIARFVGDKTKRKSPEVLGDLKKMRDAYTDKAIDDVEAPPEPTRTWSEWWNSKPAGSDEAASATALPTGPAAQAPAPAAAAPAPSPATAPAATSQGNAAAAAKPTPPDVLAQAKAAIAAGASPQAVADRLRKFGYSSEGL